MIALSSLAPAAGVSIPALMQAPPALRDTVVMIQDTAEGWAFWADTLMTVAGVILALAVIVGGLAAIPFARQAMRLLKNLNKFFSHVGKDLEPLIKQGHQMTEDLTYVTGAVRQDVTRLRQQIAGAQERLNHAAAEAEQRANEFNALLKVMQAEAEDLFIGTASTARGLRVSAETYRQLNARADSPPSEADSRRERSPSAEQHS